jgi:hypothetical protein
MRSPLSMGDERGGKAILNNFIRSSLVTLAATWAWVRVTSRVV